MEAELLALGIGVRHSRPYHPKTCGKVERFHQTLKKHLAKVGPFETKRQLQDALDRFVEYYNTVQPHRSLGRRTPVEAFNARVKAHPRDPNINVSGYRVRRDKIDKSGTVTLRHEGKFLHTASGGPSRAGASTCWWRGRRSSCSALTARCSAGLPSTLPATTSASLDQVVYYVLRHLSPMSRDITKWRRWDSNPRPPACKAGALATELRPQEHVENLVENPG